MIFKSFLFGFLLLPLHPFFAQELDCSVVVNASLVNQTNQQIFETLEQSLNEFVNTQSWTDLSVLPQERIACSFVFVLSDYNQDKFSGTLQIQAQRPVFNSDYNTLLINFIDKDIQFLYQEYSPLFYNPATFTSNLISLISYYAYIIIGLDANSYEQNAGAQYFDEAQRIVNLAAQSGSKGWKQSDGNINRFWMVDTLRSNSFSEFHAAHYNYHRQGLDQMTTDNTKAKQGVISAIKLLETLNSRRPNAMLTQIFFETKVNEIVGLFSGGNAIPSNYPVAETLTKIAPFFASKWKRIK